VRTANSNTGLQIASYEAIRAGVAAHLQHHRKSGGQGHMADQTGFAHSEHEPVRTSCEVDLVFCVLSYCPLCDQEWNGFYLRNSSRQVVDTTRNMCNLLEFPNIYVTFQIDLTHVSFYLTLQSFT
jgi:hypothetical protein